MGIMTFNALKLNVSVNKTPLLNDISVEFQAGSLTGIIGPNGAGKSTLLRVLAGLQETQSGDVLLESTPIGNISKKLLAQKISYLPQSTECHWPLTVERVVSLGRFPHQTGAYLSSDDIKAVDDACDKADIAHLIGRPINQLSGGEKARVMLARTLATQADIILADEPIASLDPQHQLEIMTLLQSLARAGKTVILVLHELHYAIRYCDKLILLNKGLKVCDGESSSVLSTQNLQNIYAINSISGLHQNTPWVLPWASLDKK